MSASVLFDGPVQDRPAYSRARLCRLSNQTEPARWQPWFSWADDQLIVASERSANRLGVGLTWRWIISLFLMTSHVAVGQPALIISVAKACQTKTDRFVVAVLAALFKWACAHIIFGYPTAPLAPPSFATLRYARSHAALLWVQAGTQTFIC